MPKKKRPIFEFNGLEGLVAAIRGDGSSSSSSSYHRTKRSKSAPPSRHAHSRKHKHRRHSHHRKHRHHHDGRYLYRDDYNVFLNEEDSRRRRRRRRDDLEDDITQRRRRRRLPSRVDDPFLAAAAASQRPMPQMPTAYPQPGDPVVPPDAHPVYDSEGRLVGAAAGAAAAGAAAAGLAAATTGPPIALATDGPNADAAMDLDAHSDYLGTGSLSSQSRHRRRRHRRRKKHGGESADEYGEGSTHPDGASDAADKTDDQNADEQQAGEEQEEKPSRRRKFLRAAAIGGATLAAGLLLRRAFNRRKSKKNAEDEQEEEPLTEDEQDEGESIFQATGPNPMQMPLPEPSLFVKVPQNEVLIVERSGKYHRKLTAGSNFVLPTDTIAFRHTLKEVCVNMPPQVCSTRENVNVTVDALIFVRTEDPVAASYSVQNSYRSLILLSQTTIKKEIGRMTLDEAFANRVMLNARVADSINEASRPWGVRCTRFELRDMMIPEELRASISREAEAERLRRADLLYSEGQRDALINRAEGEMQAQLRMSQARQMEIVNQAIGEAHAIKERGEAIAGAMRDVAEVVNEPGGEQAMRLRIAEQYIHAYARANTGTAQAGPMPHDPGHVAAAMNHAIGLLSSLDDPGPHVTNAHIDTHQPTLFAQGQPTVAAAPAEPSPPRYAQSQQTHLPERRRVRQQAPKHNLDNQELRQPYRQTDLPPSRSARIPQSQGSTAQEQYSSNFRTPDGSPRLNSFKNSQTQTTFSQGTTPTFRNGRR